jgi:hypothetical protein
MVSRVVARTHSNAAGSCGDIVEAVRPGVHDVRAIYVLMGVARPALEHAATVIENGACIRPGSDKVRRCACRYSYRGVAGCRATDF